MNVEEAAAGAEVIITRNGRPCARLAPLESQPVVRRLGGWAVPVHIAPDFDATLDPADFLEGR